MNVGGDRLLCAGRDRDRVAFAVIAARNPVHSVLFLILTFFTAAGLFVLLGAEFLAMLLVVVYVGAVAVLFLFVVMMLDVDFVELKQGFLAYLPVGALVALALMGELVLVASAAMSADGAPIALAPAAPGEVTNAEADRARALHRLSAGVPSSRAWCCWSP